MGGTRIVITRSGVTAIAAPMVASWIAGELLAFPGVVVGVVGGRIEIDLASVPDGDRPRVAAALADTLHEPRFAGWVLRSR